MEKCLVCTTRRPRRNCPALGKDICSQCCGSEREETISCPSNCSYLKEGRPFERLAPVDSATIPNGDIRIGDDFISANEQLLGFCGGTLHVQVKGHPGMTDADLLEAIGTLVLNYRAKAEGKPADAISDNPMAAAVCAGFTEKFEEFRKRLDEEVGEQGHIADDQALKLVLFFERLALNNNNGRKLGRFFIDFLATLFIPKASDKE